VHGLLSYFRKFIKNFSKIARPVTELLKGDGPVEWTPAHSAVVKQLLDLIVDAALVLPVFG